jgi:hypothetical protein
MKRLRGRSGLAGRCLLLVALALGNLGAAAGLQPPPVLPLPPPQGVPPVQAVPPTCRPEVQADSGCRSGFRTAEVCYQGDRVVSSDVGQCVAPSSMKPPKPPKAPK